MSNWIADQLAAMTRRIADLERRIENSFRMGPVEDVDPKKGLVRLKIGKGSDGTDQLSPWIPYTQIAGGLKVHAPPTKGQNMMLAAPAGEITQGFAIPVTWNDNNKAPSEKGDENVITYGDVSVSLRGGELVLKLPKLLVEAGGTTFEYTGGGFKQEGGSQEHDGGQQTHNGLNVGSTHVHSGIVKGKDDTEGPH